MFNRVTAAEFKICVKAIVAFGAGYKRGEKYVLGYMLEGLTKPLDPDAWQLGYDLATKRAPYQAV